MALRKFNPSELFLTNYDALEVLQFFFGKHLGIAAHQLTDNDRSFAQALLIEAVNASYEMSWIEELFSSSIKPGAKMKGILKALAKKALKDWLKSRDPSDIIDEPIYKSVKDTLTLNFRSAWTIRVATGSPVY